VRVGLQLEELGTVPRPAPRRTSSASGELRQVLPSLPPWPSPHQHQIPSEQAQLSEEDDPAAEAAAWESMPRAGSALPSDEPERASSTAQHAVDHPDSSVAAEASSAVHQAAVVAFTPSALASDGQQRPGGDVLWTADLAEVNAPDNMRSIRADGLRPDGGSKSSAVASAQHACGSPQQAPDPVAASATQVSSVTCSPATDIRAQVSAIHVADKDAAPAAGRGLEAAHITLCAQPEAAAQQAGSQAEGFASERPAAAHSDAAVQWSEHAAMGAHDIRVNAERADAGFQCAGVAAAATQADVPLPVESGCQTLDRHARTTQTCDDQVAAVAAGTSTGCQTLDWQARTTQTCVDKVAAVAAETSTAPAFTDLVLLPDQPTVCHASCQTEQQLPAQMPIEPVATCAVITSAGDGAAQRPDLCANPDPSPVEAPAGFWSRAEVQAAWEVEDWKRAERARFMDRMQARQRADPWVPSADTTGVKHCRNFCRTVCQYC